MWQAHLQQHGDVLLLDALAYERLLHVPRLLRGARAEARALRPVQLRLLLLARTVRVLTVLLVRKHLM